jgi:hypothetical protein
LRSALGTPSSDDDPRIAIDPEPEELLPRVSLRRILAAGIVAGTAVVLVDQAFDPSQSRLGPLRVMTILMEDLTHDRALLAALIVAGHFTVSIVYAALLSQIVARLSLRQAIPTGAVFGATIYLVNFFGLTPFAEWLQDGRNPVNFVAHLLFGAIVAIVVHTRLR